MRLDFFHRPAVRAAGKRPGDSECPVIERRMLAIGAGTTYQVTR